MGFHLNHEHLEESARTALDLFVRIYRELESRRVDPGVPRDALERQFAGTIQDEGIGLSETLEEFSTRVLPGSMGTAHPLYLGLVNSSPLPAAALGDLLISALNNNGGAYHQSPAISVLEREVIRSFSRLLGFPETASGMLLPGGTFATLQALALARARRFPDWQSAGPTSLDGVPVLYTSEASHFSVARSAEVLGVGRSGVVALPGGTRGEMDTAALRERLRRDSAAGRLPFAVVATAGTTGTGAIDPLSEIAELCRAQGLWFHVDACYGGAALLLDELRPRFQGIERADSVSVDPHKWFFIPITAALLLTRHGDLERPTFSNVDASYVPYIQEDDAYLRGIPTSRRSSGLAVWMGLRAHGWNTVREAVRRNIDLTRLIERLLEDAGFRVLPGGELSVACARWEPPGWSPDDIDELQRRIAAEVVATGRAWFAPVRHAGASWLRLNLVNLYTEERHVHEVTKLITETARRLAAGGPSDQG